MGVAMNMYKILILLLLCCSCPLVSQVTEDPDLLAYSQKDVQTNKRTRKNAELLVKKLTQGKSGDKEKFDAIFTWVTTNIQYDYAAFYVPKAFSPGRVSHILTERRTVCLGYSNLMDTLCKLAGITNVTIYGYAKDWLFDVQDTIYFHNHAWSAVKLDGLWYLYDPTWSVGTAEYQIKSRGGKWITRWLSKHPEKLKEKKLRNKYRYRMRSLCDDKVPEPVVYYKRRFFNHLLRNWISSFPVRTKRVFKRGISKDYYLSEPRVFAITHVPDNLIWNLGDKRTYRELETDSAYYYRTDSMLKTQTRQGVECPECDQYVELSFKEKLKALNVQSQASNKHNHFISALCEDQIAMINWQQARAERDSLARVQFLDSAISSASKVHSSLKASKHDLKLFVGMNKTKNRHKMNLLLSDNKGHTAFMKQKVRLTLNNTRNYSILRSQSEGYAHTYLRKAKRTKQFKVNIKTDKLKPYPEKTVTAIRKDLGKKERLIDSLAHDIRIKKQAFDSLLLGVSLNIWQQVRYHDSLSAPFIKSINLRRYMNDNYKKVIVDARQPIPENKKRYAHDLQYTVYQPSEEAFVLFKHITVLIQGKTKLQNECLQLKRELLRAKELSHDALGQYREDVIKDSEYDFCWIAGNYPKLNTTWLGFKYLKHKQGDVLDLILIENDVERHRYSRLNKALHDAYRESIRGISFDIRDAKRMLRGMTQSRKQVLKQKR